MTTPASLVLEYGPGASADDHVVCEFDPTRNVDADGNEKASFIINEDTKIYFLVHLQAGLVIEWVRSTIGTVQELGEDRQLREERCSFSFDDEAVAELQYFPDDEPECFFYGNEPFLSPVRGRELTADGENGLPAIADVSYKVVFSSFCLHLPDDLEIREGKTDYPVEIRIKVGKPNE